MRRQRAQDRRRIHERLFRVAGKSVGDYYGGGVTVVFLSEHPEWRRRTLMLKYLASYLLPTLLLTFILTTSAFAQDEKKTAYCVLLDNTRSMTKQFPQVL